MMYFYDRFYDDVCNFARRSKAKAERWAGKWTSGQIDDFNTMFYRLADNYDRYNRCGSHGMRYKAVNIINDNTIEVRIMRGTLNYDTFLATLDFLITIQKNANNISIDDLMHLTIDIDRNVSYDAPTPTQASNDLAGFLEYFNDPANKKKYMFNTNLERELLFYFDKISEQDKKEIIEFTKIKARKPL